MSSDDELKQEKKKSKKSKRETEETEKTNEQDDAQLQKSVDEDNVKKRKHKHKDKDKKKEKKSDEIEVHTANNWEEVDLGDDSRKKKFLKLMGATKHKEAEKFEETHKHFRTKNETEKINHDLEKQFSESLASKIQHKNHQGLGFADESKPSDAYQSNNRPAEADKFAKYKKMNFVKSNDS